MGRRFWSPLHLSASIGPLNVVGDDLSVNPQRLLNPNRGPMLIDQFRFSMLPIIEDATYPNLGVLAVEIRLGSIPLMPHPVTLGSLAPRFRGAFNGVYSFAAGSPALANPVAPIGDTIFVWHLHKPLFVPKNVQLSVRVVRQALFAPGTLNEPTDGIDPFRVSVVGRSLPENEPSPPNIWVPWVSETKARVAAPTFDSPDSDLVNSHDVPLHVKSFIGYDTTSISGGNTHFGTHNVRMTASNGTTIVREPTPFGLLFPYDRGNLEVDALLQPGQYVRVGIETAAPVGALAAQGNVQFTSISMVGYRRVPTPKSN
jgi:hypothetical protein